MFPTQLITGNLEEIHTGKKILERKCFSVAWQSILQLESCREIGHNKVTGHLGVRDYDVLTFPNCELIVR